MLIGAVAKAAKCDVQTVRYYEKIGLLPKPGRSSGNQRFYTPEHLERLTFIRHGRALGFSLGRIQRFIELGCNLDHSCSEVDAITRQCLADVEANIVRLEGLRAELKRMIDRCSGKTVSDCQIIHVLADHGQCLIQDHGESQ